MPLDLADDTSSLDQVMAWYRRAARRIDGKIQIIIDGKIQTMISIQIRVISPEKMNAKIYDDVIKWKHVPRYWPFAQGIHRSPVNSPHKGQWRGALMFPLICVWINSWVNNREAGDLRRYLGHYDVTVMIVCGRKTFQTKNLWSRLPYEKKYKMNK